MNRLLAVCTIWLSVSWTGSLAGFTYLNTYNPATGHYYALSEKPEFFLDARAEAAELGTYLATINDASENQWVQSNFGGLLQLAGDQRLWIGLTDEVNEGTFVWDNGETSSFRNWVPGEPDPALPIIDYVELILHHPGSPANSGQWNDNDNTAFNWALIESSNPVSAPPASVPVPSSMLLFGTGLFGLIGYVRLKTYRGA